MHKLNFPKNLDIQPAADDGTVTLVQDIAQYGLAGRSWHATFLLREYAAHPERYDPPLPVQHRNVVVDLGSGTGTHGLFLASVLSAQDAVILTDLPDVVPLIQANVEANKHTSRATVDARPLSWGSTQDARALPHPTLVTASDVVYFPELHALLLRTMLDLCQDAHTPLVMAYRIRSSVKEEPFFLAWSFWFRFEAVKHRSDGTRLGFDDESYVLVAYRKQGTLDAPVPLSDAELMALVSDEFHWLTLMEMGFE